MFDGPFSASIIKRAIEKNLVSIDIVNLRDFAVDSYGTVDDHPYGGGTGMILKVDIMDKAVQSIRAAHPDHPPYIILLTPQGAPYRQKKANLLAKKNHILLICGHYEGFDERIRSLADEEISIGDYVLTGGEIPALVLADSIIRLIPKVLKRQDATFHESFGGEKGILEYPQYTKPNDYKTMNVPPVLLSGDHKKIEMWRKEQAQIKTKKNRKDLLG